MILFFRVLNIDCIITRTANIVSYMASKYIEGTNPFSHCILFPIFLLRIDIWVYLPIVFRNYTIFRHIILNRIWRSIFFCEDFFPWFIHDDHCSRVYDVFFCMFYTYVLRINNCFGHSFIWSFQNISEQWPKEGSFYWLLSS